MEATTVELLRQNIDCTAPDEFNSVLSGFPQQTLDAVLQRVLHGSQLERYLYVDVFNVSRFNYDKDGRAEVDALRHLNATVLTSDLIDDIDASGWFGWDAVRYTLMESLYAIPKDTVDLDEMDAHRLRSAVLVNIVVDRSYARPGYQEKVDFFKKNYDAIRACLPALAERHKELREVDLGIVEEFISNTAALAEGAL